MVAVVVDADADDGDGDDLFKRLKIFILFLTLVTSLLVFLALSHLFVSFWFTLHTTYIHTYKNIIIIITAKLFIVVASIIIIIFFWSRIFFFFEGIFLFPLRSLLRQRIRHHHLFVVYADRQKERERKRLFEEC
ncbi:hypothetical protein SSS_09856 [Sarcoptes scabiei]|nr:hypothetical protein SSS_09856 [Sarcoptes scabiei]